MDVRLMAHGWVRHRSVAVRGVAFDDARRLEARDVADRFGRAVTGVSGDPEAKLDAVADCAASLEGFFGAVIETAGETILVADQARSIPLWFDVEGSVCSDRGRLLREAIDAPRDPITEREFHCTRYVTGGETIWAGVGAVAPGEVVAVSDDGVRRQEYWAYWPDDDHGGPGIDDRDDQPTDPVLERLRNGLETALDRLEAVAGERPIVLPLSGGYDSRLLAAALVEREREVIAFTFGRSGHPDVEVSREIASNLGIRWEFVPYSRDDWRAWYHGDACRTYREWAFGGDGLPFLAAWPAVRALLEAGRLPEDGLYCPGHTVATPSERLPRFRATDAAEGPTGNAGRPAIGCGPAVDAEDTDDQDTIAATLDALVEYVLERHYTLWDWQDESFTAHARRRIRRGLCGSRAPLTLTNLTALAAAYEHWEWRGRMSTFTNGDLRGYEDAGLAWWLPLWDPAYVRAWETVPYARRRGKRLHAELAVDTYQRVADVSRARAAVTDRRLEPVDRLLSLVRHTPERQFTERGGDWEPPFLAPRSAWRIRGQHPLAWDGIVEDALWDAFPDRNVYAYRTLAETGYLDLLHSVRTPAGTTLEAVIDD